MRQTIRILLIWSLSLSSGTFAETTKSCEKCPDSVCDNALSRGFAACYDCCWCAFDRYQTATILSVKYQVQDPFPKEQPGRGTVIYELRVRMGKDAYLIGRTEDKICDDVKSCAQHPEWQKNALIELCIRNKKQCFVKSTTGAPFEAYVIKQISSKG